MHLSAFCAHRHPADLPSIIVKATLSAPVSVDEFSASYVSAFNGPVPGLLGMFGLEGGCVGAGFVQRYALTNRGIRWDAFFVSFQGIRKL